jgi:mannose-6-phosphate isomerase-like protein (cupin superfamily)
VAEQVPLEKRRVTFADAMARLPGPGGERYAAVFDDCGLEVEIFAPRGHDPQKPHTRNEAYVVIRGTGTFWNGVERHPVAPGDFVFVPAGVPHRFEDFSEDFAVWGLFFGDR